MYFVLTIAMSLSAEMGLHGGDVWGHIAPMFHLVDVFAVYAVTFLGGRHVTLQQGAHQKIHTLTIDVCN